PPAEVVAGAVGHKPPGRGGEQFVERTFNERGAVLRPADAARTNVDHAGLWPGGAGDEVNRLEQPHGVAEIGQPSGIAVRQVDEDEISIWRDPGWPARLAVPCCDVHGAGTVRAAASWVRDRGVVSELLIRPRVLQRVVDFFAAVDGPVPVRLRARPRRLVPLIPEGQKARSPGRLVAAARCLVG